MKKDELPINVNLAAFMLRVGGSAVFLYAAIAATINPAAWLGYIPAALDIFFPPTQFLILFSLFELILGLWLLSGRKTFHAAVLSSITMLAITVGNITALDIVFRDIAILFSNVALAVLSYREEK